LRKAFELVDTTKDGMLDKAELRSMLQGMDGGNRRDHISDADVDEFTRNADTNGDGLISFEEFVE
jgi:Ca2+-binding EF-hand superfamily protein